MASRVLNGRIAPGTVMAMTTVAGTRTSPRITSLDALRGAGILGILALNVQLFAFVAAARPNPTVYGDLHGANWWAWLAIYTFADGKFTGVFAMLFGAGIVIFAAKPEETSVTARLHYRRMAVLLLLGLVHAYLLWSHDILVTLALCGAAVFQWRGLAPGRLIGLGMLVFAMASVILVLSALLLPHLPSGDVASAVRQWAPPPEAIANEIASYRGGWWAQMAHRVPAAFEVHTTHFITHAAWQMGGLMLVGMGMLKRGVFDAARSTTFYVWLAAGGFGAGISLILAGARHSFARRWELGDYLLIGGPLTYWGDLLVGLGWVGVIMLLCRRGWPLRSLAAVGRTALTNYLVQTVICTTIFYGHGLGLFARVERAGQLAIVVGVWIVELAASSLWLERFDFGPVEWAWRCATYGRWLPIRRPAGQSAVG